MRKLSSSQMKIEISKLHQKVVDGNLEPPNYFLLPTDVEIRLIDDFEECESVISKLLSSSKINDSEKVFYYSISFPIQFIL